MYKKHLDEEEEIVLAIKRGAINHDELGEPDHHIETGLAHIFFFGNRVFKQYKIANDHDHFIKGVLAPTERRHQFLQRDFALNQHFSRGLYKKLHGHAFDDQVLSLTEYDASAPHVWFEMERLDFSQNLHEQLLRQEVSLTQLRELGAYIAESVAHSPVVAPEEVNWYELATKRIAFLEQFVDWLPEQYRIAMNESGVVTALKQHLEAHRDDYEAMTGAVLVVSMDNHDENIFFREDGPVFIDVVPPMESWWYGTPWINLANVVVNVETLLSPEAAAEVEAGYMEYHGLTELPQRDYMFAKALAYAISVAHFGSLEDKGAVAEKYLIHCQEIPGWLQ